MALEIFLSKTPKLVSSDLDRTHVSETYVSAGQIKVLCNFAWFFMDKNWDQNWSIQRHAKVFRCVWVR